MEMENISKWKETNIDTVYYWRHPIFHFHDCARKGSQTSSPMDLESLDFSKNMVFWLFFAKTTSDLRSRMILRVNDKSNQTRNYLPEWQVGCRGRFVDV